MRTLRLRYGREIKKGRYVYYHCTGYKGKCPEPYTGEEVLEKAFTGLLRGISFTEDVLDWVSRALRESHRDEKEFHRGAIARLQREHRRIQERIDAMYMDKLDGRIDNVRRQLLFPVSDNYSSLPATITLFA